MLTFCHFSRLFGGNSSTFVYEAKTSIGRTHKTSQNVRPCVHACGVNIFKTLRLPDRWADVDET